MGWSICNRTVVNSGRNSWGTVHTSIPIQWQNGNFPLKWAKSNKCTLNWESNRFQSSLYLTLILWFLSFDESVFLNVIWKNYLNLLNITITERSCIFSTTTWINMENLSRKALPAKKKHVQGFAYRSTVVRGCVLYVCICLHYVDFSSIRPLLYRSQSIWFIAINLKLATYLWCEHGNKSFKICTMFGFFPFLTFAM